MTRDRLDVLQPFVDAHARLGNGVPEWLIATRTKALEKFRSTGFPDTSDESWRFTSIRPILEQSFSPATTTPPGIDIADVSEAFGLSTGPLLVLVNGRLSPELSKIGKLPSGVRVEGLAQALRNSPDQLRPLVERSLSLTQDAFAALNHAFLADGAFVHVPRGCKVEIPITVLHVTAGASGHAVFPRLIVVIDREAEATLNEIYVGREGGAYLAACETTTVLGDGARLRHYRVQLEDMKAFHVAGSHWTLGRDSVLESCSFALGAALSRHQLTGVLDGTNATLTLDGLSILSGEQHGDHHTTIDHAKPHCESHEVFNGVYADGARGVFNGRIIVRPGAQRTDSKQTSNNLLLSDRARADTQPQLEIYADDVKCTHGATLGPLDETALFYLLSRGLDRTEARGALTYGFAAEILARVAVPEIRARLDRRVRQALRATLGQAA